MKERSSSEGRIVKKIFMVANLYHASPRIPSLCKYLPRYGWEPTILTPRITSYEGVFNAPSADVLSLIHVVEVGEPVFYEKKKESKVSSLANKGKGLVNKIDPSENSELSRKIDRLYWSAYSMANYPDADRGWKEPALEKARRILAEENFDALLSSSSPVTTHLIAHELKEEYKIPWIAEFRDLWSQNYNLAGGRMMRKRTARLEKEVIKTADALVTVNPHVAADLGRLHVDKRVFSFTNGYDPLLRVPESESPRKFTMAYTGQIYKGKQDPSMVVEAVKRLIDEGSVPRDQIEIRFYGPKNDDLERMTHQAGLEDVVHAFGVVTRNESYQHQREAHLLLYFSWEDEQHLGIVATKFYEYLGSGRPILVTKAKPDDEVVRIIGETACGKIAYDLDQTASAILEFYREYLTTREVRGACNPAEVAKYSYASIAEGYAQMLDDLIEPSNVRNLGH